MLFGFCLVGLVFIWALFGFVFWVLLGFYFRCDLRFIWVQFGIHVDAIWVLCWFLLWCHLVSMLGSMLASTWVLLGICLGLMWSPCGFHFRFFLGFYLASMWLQFCLNVVLLLLDAGFYLGSIYVSHVLMLGSYAGSMFWVCSGFIFGCSWLLCWVVV